MSNGAPPRAHGGAWVARAAGFTIAAAAAAHLVGQLLGTRSLAAELLAAIVVELIAARAGAPWDAPESFGRSARQVAEGVALALAAVVATVVAGTLLGWVTLVPWRPAIDAVVLGVVRAGAIAVRTELTFRWIPLRLAAGRADRRAVAAFTVALGAAPLVLDAPSRPGAVVVALGTGALSAALIVTGRGLLAAFGAHAAIVFLTSVALTSGLEARWSNGSWIPLDRATGPGAYLLGATTLAAAAWVVRRSRRV